MKLVVFLHVPKAAGNSVIHDLKQKLPRSRSIQWDNIDEDWDAFIKEHDKQPYQMVSGHIRWRHIDILKQRGIDYELISFVRDPVSRLVSDYNYNCLASTPGSESFQKKFPDFRIYAEAKSRVNGHSKFMVPQSIDGGRTMARFLQEEYKAIGVMEFFQKSLVHIHESLDLAPDVLESQKNPTPKDRMKVNELGDSIAEFLIQENAVDYVIYRECLKRIGRYI